MSTKKSVSLLPIGIFLLVGLGLLGWMIIQYGGNSNRSKDGYVVNVEFENAAGIIEGGIVRLGGATVGSIESEPLLQPNRTVLVPITIRNEIELPKNTKFEIVSLSPLGDKAIYLKVPDPPSEEILKNGDHIMGESPIGLGEITGAGRTLLNDTQEALSSYQEVAEKLNVSLENLNNTLLKQERLLEMEQAVKNVSEASESIKEASQSFKELAKSLHPLANDARLTITEYRNVAKGASETITNTQSTIKATKETMLEAKGTMVEARDTLVQAQSTFKKIDGKIEDLDPTLKALPKTLETYSKVGQSLEKSLNSEDSLLSTVTKDKEVKDDAKTFVKNLRTNGILGYKDDSDPDKDDPRDRYRGMRR